MLRCAVLPLWVLLSACPAQAPSDAENTAAQCSDGVDNDSNGLRDCADVSCAQNSFCVAMQQADGGSDDGHVSDSGSLCSAPIDVVFVIDVSTSMGNVLEALATGLQRIWDEASHLSSNAQFSLVVFVDDALALNGCAPYSTPEAFLTDFWALVATGSASPVSHVYNQDTPENSLDALYLAATTCTWRADATRIVVHATDDTFREPPYSFSSVGPGTGVPAVHTYAEVSEALVSRQLRLGTFAPLNGFCTNDPIADPSAGVGYATAYRGMPSLADATGGRAWFICDVTRGTLDMGAAISEMVSDEYCTLY